MQAYDKLDIQLIHPCVVTLAKLDSSLEFTFYDKLKLISNGKLVSNLESFVDIFGHLLSLMAHFSFLLMLELTTGGCGSGRNALTEANIKFA